MASIILPEGIQTLSGLEANRASVIPDVGELLFTTDDRLLFAGDGVTAGGNRLNFLTLLGGTVDGNVNIVRPVGTQSRFRMEGNRATVQLRDKDYTSGLQAFEIVSDDGELAVLSKNDDYSNSVNFTTLRIAHQGGVRVGASGNDQGYGSVNAESYFVNDVPLGFNKVTPTTELSFGAATVDTNVTLTAIPLAAKLALLEIAASGNNVYSTVRLTGDGVAFRAGVSGNVDTSGGSSVFYGSCLIPVASSTITYRIGASGSVSLKSLGYWI